MTAHNCLCDLRARGAVISAVGDRLRVTAPAGTLTTDLLEVLRDHKGELLVLLREEDSRTRFGSEAAGLYPLIGGRVLTPDGPGTLLEVRTAGAGVVLESDPSKVRRYSLDAITRAYGDRVV